MGRQTWPEAHYPEDGGAVEVCWDDSVNCGIRAEGKLCAMSECDSHIVDIIAPNSNFLLPPDPIGTCVLGKGTVAATANLPQVAATHQPADAQFEWMNTQEMQARRL